jgi:type I restriction enzyme M protein
MSEKVFDIGEILRASGKGYGLELFTKKEIKQITLFSKKGKPYLKCFATSKERPAKPEEIVRQLYLWRLIHEYGYPSQRISIEKPVYFGSSVHEKAADIVICEEGDTDTAYIIVECKKPKRRDGIEQLKSYCNAEGSPIGVWTNGGEIAFLHRQEPNLFRSLPDIPRADQQLGDLLEERWDMVRLTEENKLIKERLTLKSIILDMEDLVLANAGVDAFEEVFKLIYAKLYDEWSAQRNHKGKKFVEFRLYGSSPQQLYDRISTLFNKAKSQWPGVFLGDEKIELEPAHLLTCVSFLEDIKLFNSNLQIIDEAFEYLAVQVGKGSKGQYFTPRYVIDMCVKMLNPKVDEFMIDTASGSCGFTVHSIFHVCGSQFTAEKWERWQIDYAANNVYGIDFDARSVKIAKALNLIAGDGKTNVYKANTLDPRNWPEDVRVAMRQHLRRFPDDRATDEFNQKNFRYFNFDVLMTNPPFAGDIKDSRILHQFDLAKNERGKWRSKVGRDILFIERNLEFLKPGGRMAIVLPQGRYNNTSDEYIRKFIADKARIIAVVGLHNNTFKPHTGTKTSILFLQKWDYELCSKKDNYPIFFAVSEKGGKDNSGEYVYLKDNDDRPKLDKFGHLIIDHDLHNQDGELPDGIAESFINWAKKEKIIF